MAGILRVTRSQPQDINTQRGNCRRRSPRRRIQFTYNYPNSDPPPVD